MFFPVSVLELNSFMFKALCPSPAFTIFNTPNTNVPIDRSQSLLPSPSHLSHSEWECVQCTCARDFLFIYQIKRAKTKLHVFAYMFSTLSLRFSARSPNLYLCKMLAYTYSLSIDRQKNECCCTIRFRSTRYTAPAAKNASILWKLLAVLQHNDLKRIHGRCVCCL